MLEVLAWNIGAVNEGLGLSRESESRTFLH
jgi:hypothetical protein